MASVAVVVPIYTTDMSCDEIVSIEQCLRILGSYHLFLLCPNDLNVSGWPYYSRFELVRFDSMYFKSTRTYSDLLLKKAFYKRFLAFDFILIYQTDAWVFKDELKYWMEQGYDYIGAPWFTYGTHNHNDGLPESVGNGGFSLRNVKKHIAVCTSRARIVSINELEIHARFWSCKFYMQIFIKFLKCLGVHNNLSYLRRNYKGNEDYFFGVIASKYYVSFKVAPIDVAMKFSFEEDPEFWYNRNGMQLPFGCHAWKKNNLEFWSNFIRNEKA